MIPGIMGLIIIGILVVGALAWYYRDKEKTETKRQIDRLSNSHSYKMRILCHLLGKKNSSDYKMSLMETLNIEIEMFKICVDQLTNEKLATAAAHTLTLTDFGKKYAKIYAEEEVNKLK